MGKHSKILDSWKDYTQNNIPVYHVIKSSKYGVFHGIVIPCPQDYNNINDWDGYRFAERKCDIQIIKRKAAIMREHIKGMEIVLNTLTNKYNSTSTPLPDSDEFLQDLLYQINIHQKEYEKVYAQYKYMRDSFRDYTTRIIQERIKLQERKNNQD